MPGHSWLVHRQTSHGSFGLAKYEKIRAKVGKKYQLNFKFLTIYPKKSNFNPLAGIFAHFWRNSFFSQPFCGEHFVYCQPPDWDIWYNLTFTTFLGWTQEQRLHFSGLWVWCPPLKKHAHWNASINTFFFVCIIRCFFFSFLESLSRKLC